MQNQNNGLYSFPYYPALVGVGIPKGSVHGKTSVSHALLYGAISVHAGQNTEGCFASLDCLASELQLTKGTIKSYLKDLENLGWVVIKRNKNGEYTNAFPQLIIQKSVTVVTRGRYHGNEEVVTTVTNPAPVATPVLNNNINNNKKSSAVGGNEDFSVPVHVNKTKPTVAPFDVDVVDVKKVKQKDGKNYGALAARLLAKSGKKGAVTDTLVKAVREKEKVYGEKVLFEVVEKAKFDPFWATKGLRALLSESGIEDILNRDNRPEDILALPKSDPRRIEYMKKHKELWS